MSIIQAHNLIDYEAFDEPLRRSVMRKSVGGFFGKNLKIKVSLNKHTATINDELLNPLNSSENEFSYL